MPTSMSRSCWFISSYPWVFSDHLFDTGGIFFGVSRNRSSTTVITIKLTSATPEIRANCRFFSGTIDHKLDNMF